MWATPNIMSRYRQGEIPSQCKVSELFTRQQKKTRMAAREAVIKRKRPRPSLNRLDRFFWTTIRQIWLRWSDVLVICKTGDGGRMASGGLSPILALAIRAAAADPR
jgi:hypothetical protein